MNKQMLYNKERLSALVGGSIIDDPVNDDTPKVNKLLLDLIYAPDEKTGIPQGELAIFLSDKANAQVKEFIQANLLAPVDESGEGLSIPQDMVNKLRSTITDDDLDEYSRNANETIDEYAQRMSEKIEKERIKNYTSRARKAYNRALRLRDKLAENH